MQWLTVPPEQALGQILCHNLADAQGHKALHKGTKIGEKELAQLRALGMRAVTVAMLDPDDVHEDAAAARLTRACVGDGVTISAASGGRMNLLAQQTGILKIQREALHQINLIDGLTIATLRHDSLVQAHKIVATIKIIPYAVSAKAMAQAEAIGQTQRNLVSVRALRPQTVGVILAGSASAQVRVTKAFLPAINSRIAELGSTPLAMRYVPHESQAIADALQAVCGAGAALCIIAGETSIMDRDDVTPRGIVLAGGRIEHYGAPVEPGNLLLLAYLDASSAGSTSAMPVIGAPGCVRSRDLNVVDLILPRLLSGERLKRADVIALAEGGLLL